MRFKFGFYHLLEVGIGAGLVSRDTEDTSLFSVATNVPGQQEVDETPTCQSEHFVINQCYQVVFKLEYDELLERKDEWYQHLVNLGQDKIIPDLKVELFIKETLPLRAVKVPQLLQSNEIDGSTRDLRGELEQVGEQTNWAEGLSHLVYQPTSEQQQTAQQEGVSGQFKVKYQVQMKPEGEVQVNILTSDADMKTPLLRSLMGTSSTSLRMILNWKPSPNTLSLSLM